MEGDSSELAHRQGSRPSRARRRIPALEEGGRQGAGFRQSLGRGKEGETCGPRVREGGEDGAATSRTGALSLEGTDPAGAVVAGTGHGFRDREAEAVRRPDVGDGMQPAEIERGVTVRRVQGGIEIEIPGAKVTETKGQPRRKILIDAKSPAGLHLGMALGAKAEIEMSRGAKRIGHDFADIRRRTGLATVSAYSFRHQVSSDLKAAGVDKNGIAQVLGHASERTQGRYGKPSKGRAGGGIIIDAIASREVRTGRPAGPGADPTLEV